jgi:hypothetical protein
MKKSLSGEANLVSLEPELCVEVSMKELGRISMRVEITPDHMTQEHSFQFEIDQSYLSGLIESCRKVLSKYPLKGKSDAGGEA